MPAGGPPPSYSAASNQPPQQQPPVGYSNGLQPPPHDPADNGGSRGDGGGPVKESQPVPGTTLHTAGGDEEVSRYARSKWGWCTIAAPRDDDEQL